MDVCRVMLLLLVVAATPLSATAQALADTGESSGTIAIVTPAPPELPYIRPTTRMKLNSYLFESFGPYPIVGAAIVGGIDQFDNAPPEWKQGSAGFGKRFGSAFGINAVTITTRYGLAQAFHEDTLYYGCECKGVLPRFGHAIISTFTARRGDDGHRVFSFSAFVSPYAGTMTAVYAWYPGRYNAKDAFRMGNYSLLGYVAENVALEFFHRGPHSFLSRMHLNDRHGAQDPGPNP